VTISCRRERQSALAMLLAGLFAASISSICLAQTVTVTGPNGQPMTLTPEQMKAMRRGGGPPGQPQPGGPPGAQPGQEAKPEEKKKEGDDKKKESEPYKRPEKPPRPPDPKDFKFKLDANGRVPPFNFIGQPWPDVMQWIATISKCSLNYQTLPGGFLNLTTQRSYTVDEVRDLINHHLMALKYISIQSGEVLDVYEIDKIDPSLVRPVKEVDLYTLKPYDYVQVTFELPPGMEVDKAKEDVKQVLHPTAKIFPLVTSRQLVLMDTVANLRTVSRLLNEERMVQDGRIVPKEIRLKYARPQQVIEVLYMMLGLDPKAKPAQTDPNQQQQQIAMMQQMQQQGRAAEAAKMMQNPSAPKVYLAYNRQRNSVLVNAPPEQMKVIEQTIAYLDVPYGDIAEVPGANGASDNGRRMRKYSLQSLDPDKFVSTLEEIGGLSPTTVFKVDDNNKALFAMATEADHAKIEKLLHDFDGSGRHFKVIALRRSMPADAVAATIYKLMAGQNDKKEEKRRPYWYDYYDSGRDEKKKDTIQGFGVDADIENNQLMLWANDIELEQVHQLLVELGAIPPDGQHDVRQVRVLEQIDSKVTPQLLKRLQEEWAASGGNQLIIPNPPTETKPEASPQEKEKKDKEKAEKASDKPHDRSAGGSGRNRIVARLAALDSTSAEEAGNVKTKDSASQPAPNAVNPQQPATTAPSVKPAEPTTQSTKQPSGKAPVTITFTPDGRWMISSTDTAALDRMEQLVEQITPPQRRFKVYRLQFISATDMYLDLKNFFKEDMEKESGGMTLDWYGRPIETGKGDKGATGLAKRHKLMLDWDPASNSVIIANASASQLAEAEEMIKEFDKPPPKDSVEKRTTRPIKIQYSKPTVIAAAIKEVYRDLLSTRDKEFERGEQKEKKANAERMTVINYGGGGGSGGDEGSDRGSAVKVGFEGALSLGADDVSGVLIVSAQQAIFADIEKMVHELDNQAAPKTTVSIYRLSGAVSPEALQKALDKSVGKPWLGNRPEQQPNQTGPPPEEKKREDRGRNRNEKNQEGSK
jgi:type II secretory pathway component GspD/PulD (secretin)